MKHDKIVVAYDRAAPDPGAEARIWERICREADAAPARRPRPILRRALTAAACIILAAALLTAGYAAYEKWKLPAPEPYVPNENSGNVSVHAESSYTVPTELPDPAEAASLSDEYFLLRAREILAQAGVEPKGDTATVRRQTHLYWNREEAEVSWPNAGTPVSVTFDAEKGVFIGMSGIGWVLSDAAACETQAEADALARRYYESLPVEQGYVMAGCEKYDEQFWSYDFCREVEPGLFSWYECVRVAINPVSGGLDFCKVFYVPLLDDHEPGDVPLTEAEAIERARSVLGAGEGGEAESSVSVQKTVEIPNWFFTGQAVLNHRASDVSRLCWKVVFEDDSGLFLSRTTVLVDYWTGEILGGDVV